MRDFIKKQIQERMNVASKNNEPEEVSNEAILEYASLFQELDDLSLEGSEDGNARKLSMDMPLDDDAELETVEFDLGSGKVKDVPDTASIQESYNGMKTFDKFYQEAYESLTRLPRESEGGFERRVRDYAEEMYNEYCADAEACGYFGFDKINISNDKVPSKLNVNFGTMNEGSTDNFVTKVNAFFATDADHNITQKQLDSVELVKNGALKHMGSSLKAYMESTYDVDKERSVWDVCTPKTLIVPKGNADSFCVVVEYTNEVTGKNEYFGWTAPVSNTDDTITMESCEKFNMESFINETQYENHDKFIQEQKELAVEEHIARRVRPQRFFQEAIDLGGDTSTEAPATDDTASTDTGSTEGDADASTEAPADENKETAAVNNVSTEIAEKVANDTQNDAESNDEQVTFSDETNPDANINTPDAGSLDDAPVEDDMVGDEGAPSDDADNMLNDLDTSTDAGDVGDDSNLDEEPIEGTDEEGTDDGSTGDIENIDDMSVNDLLKMGTESLKNMKVGDLKNLIASGDNEAIQEAFIITSKNVNKEVDIKLRKCLGILNDNKDSADKILVKFKGEGHKLNRLLSKAAKMTPKVYSSDEVASIKKLNSSLGELLLALRKKPENYAAAIKGKIADFNKEAKVVGAIIEDKLGKQSEDGVLQEGFVQEGLFLSSSNAKKRLGRKITPVYTDMMSIVKMADAQLLNKGKINKMYKPVTRTSTSGWTYEPGQNGGFGHQTSQTNVVEYNTPQSENLNELQRILTKIIRKPKVQKAFTSDEMGMISELMDRLDDFVDLVEALIYDNSKSDNTALIEKIGEYAKKIVELLNGLGENTGSPMTGNATDDTSVESEEDIVDPATDVESETKEEEVEIPEDDEGIEEEPDVEDDEEEGEDE